MGCSSSIKIKSKSPATDASEGDTVDQKEQEEPETLIVLEVDKIHGNKPDGSHELREKLPEVPDVRGERGALSRLALGNPGARLAFACVSVETAKAC
ncbi:hypothetical protein SKAU_G00427820 [Synaphobranchus kaupii]|uniref:Uncharacterized protein n=1 Tax=Synaphobranchus kaupii TaxID=118154 RepID=A0A9Q1IA87_SYNKA|nr:hypothetical protein SKAU_G00427820 [Synaphobranchus kaupii]